MSYDTTVNDALDPPEARLPAARRSALRWKFIAIGAIAAIVVVMALGGWALLR
jgi:hypothetical protein